MRSLQDLQRRRRGLAKRRLQDLEVRGQRVLVRVDFNVPIEQGREYIASYDHRLRQTLPTIQHLRGQGAKTILCSHLGRPGGKVVDELRLWPVGDRLGVLLGSPVTSIDQCVGAGVSAAINGMGPEDVLLLENLRFHAEEEGNDPDFAKALGSVARPVRDGRLRRGTPGPRLHGRCAPLPSLGRGHAASARGRVP